MWEAVQSGNKAVQLSPEWPEARLTLARAQLALGEVNHFVGRQNLHSTMQCALPAESSYPADLGGQQE